MTARPALIAVACLALFAAALLAACGGADEDAPPFVDGGATWVDDPFSGGYPTYRDEASGLTVVFGTPDLGAGESPSRVSFALFDYEGLVSYPALTVRTRYYPDGGSDDFEVGEEASLRFQRFPEGGRGIYAGYLSFDRAGLWAIEAAVPQADGAVAQVLFPVPVAVSPVAPAVGAAAPPSANRTLQDAPLPELTTAYEPDPTLYERTIQAALGEGAPFVVVFASPAFCTNALCGPQVEVTSELAAAYGDRASFIHVELYENPTEIRGDLSVARRTPVLDEWGIHTDEWTFVVDGEGRVAARFEGFAPREEVEEALLAVLP